MGYHYIPQFYLEGFACPPSIVWVYERGTKRVFGAPVKRVAQENNFYYREIEQDLANEIENPANPALKKVRDRETLKPAEKAALCRYIAVMDTRVPAGKHRTRTKFREECKPMFEWFDNQLATLAERNPAGMKEIEARRKHAQQLQKDWMENPPEALWQSVVLSRQTSRTVQVLNSMTWCFLLASEGESFLTSDNPVFIFRDIGILHEGSELTFPIASDIALFASHTDDWSEGHFIQANQVITHEINRRTVRQASRYVFHCREAGWVVKLVNKRRIKVRRIARLLRY